MIHKKLAVAELGDFPHYIMHTVDFHHSLLPAFRNVSIPRMSNKHLYITKLKLGFSNMGSLITPRPFKKSE